MRTIFLNESNAVVGVITINDLQKSFPALAREYQSIFGSKRPTIKVVSTEVYSAGGGGQGTQQIAVFYKNGQTKVIKGSWGGANPWADKTANALDMSSEIKLSNDEAVMECVIGSFTMCELFIHPSLANPQMLGSADQSSDLDLFEIAALTLMHSLISSARKASFFDFLPTSGGFGGYEAERAFKEKPSKEAKTELIKSKYVPAGVKTNDDLWNKVLQNLAAKKLVRISSNGATQLTIEGKNIVARFNRNM